MIEEGIGEYANPSSLLKALEMMLRHIAMADKADVLANAMAICTETEKRVVVTGNRDGATCKEFADYVLEKL
jgi:isocitrate dehydrogenase (NAD+)